MFNHEICLWLLPTLKHEKVKTDQISLAERIKISHCHIQIYLVFLQKKKKNVISYWMVYKMFIFFSFPNKWVSNVKKKKVTVGPTFKVRPLMLTKSWVYAAEIGIHLMWQCIFLCHQNTVTAMGIIVHIILELEYSLNIRTAGPLIRLDLETDNLLYYSQSSKLPT